MFIFSGIFCLLLLSISSWFVSYASGLTVIYNDAMSHLDISRLVIDDIQPGFSQLGGVWLPLNHLLSLSLIWNNWAWHSGFAGSFFSMISYIISAIAIAAIVYRLSKNRLASFFGGAVFATNLNMLYLQTTPLTEPLYVGTFTLSVFFFLCWLQSRKDGYLILLGFLGLLQIFSRYDGWFVVGIQALLICIHQLFIRRAPLQEALGKLVIFIFPSIFAIGIWLLWNFLIFHSALYFLTGPYSAHAQQTLIQSHSGLLTKNNLYESVRAYLFTALDTIGLLTLIPAFLAIPIFLYKKIYNQEFSEKIIFFMFLITPVVFNIIALYFGFSILNVPELHWNPSHEYANQWFNVRYGILALPFVAVMLGLLMAYIKRWRGAVVLLFLLLITQIYMTYSYGIITITDGKVGASSFTNQDVADYLQSHVGKNEKVLLSMSSFNAVAFRSGLPLNQIIHEGISSEWSKALAYPENYAQWIVMANGKLSEPVYTSLVENQKNRFLSLYDLVYKGAHANIYHLKSTDQIFITAKDNNLYAGSKIYSIHGVNSYSLAYLSNAQIQKNFEDMHQIGVNTIRFWLFDDGNPNGIQPSAGILNEAALRQADEVFAMANKYHIRVIPVLLNNWTDYGGKEQYCSWVGIPGTTCQDDFYTNPLAISLYKNYLNHILSRINSITHVSYSNDPTILSWEVMNEPRTGDDNTPAMMNWISQMASYIKQKDPNHLVSSGSEYVSLVANHNSQTFNVCKMSAIDICTVHLYATSGSDQLYPTYASMQQFLKQQYTSSVQAHKPVILEEVGISKSTKPFGLQPLDVLHGLQTSAQQSGYRGSLIWNWALQPDDSFGFSPNGVDNHYTLEDLQHVLNSENQ